MSSKCIHSVSPFHANVFPTHEPLAPPDYQAHSPHPTHRHRKRHFIPPRPKHTPPTASSSKPTPATKQPRAARTSQPPFSPCPPGHPDSKSRHAANPPAPPPRTCNSQTNNNSTKPRVAALFNPQRKQNRAAVRTRENVRRRPPCARDVRRLTDRAKQTDRSPGSNDRLVPDLTRAGVETRRDDAFTAPHRATFLGCTSTPHNLATPNAQTPPQPLLPPRRPASMTRCDNNQQQDRSRSS